MVSDIFGLLRRQEEPHNTQKPLFSSYWGMSQWILGAHPFRDLIRTTVFSGSPSLGNFETTPAVL